MDKSMEIERSIIKKYRKELWARFIRGVQTYNLIEKDDNIMVCISGGKDSFLLAKLIQELMKHGKDKFNARFVCMNPGYLEENKNLILENAKKLNIPLEMFESDIFDVVDNVGGKSPCYLCARMRRGYLYAKARELGCNKIALGHHFDDVIETTLLSILYGAEYKTMMPKLHSDNFPGIDLIRPMYLVKEHDIIAWKNYNGLEFLNCACKLTAGTKEGTMDSKRKEIKELIKYLKTFNKDVDYNIFKSADNVNLSCVLGTKKDGVYKSFLDDYEDNR